MTRARTGLGAYPLGSPQHTYGSGYCGVCGTTNVVPRLVKWWDCDDGWRVGVLCSGCFGDAKARPPRPTDYAYRKAKHLSDTADILASVHGDDSDAIISDYEDFA